MGIQLSEIRVGDRVTFKRLGAYKTRGVAAVGDNYVTVLMAAGEIKVPEHLITSVVSRTRG